MRYYKEFQHMTDDKVASYLAYQLSLESPSRPRVFRLCVELAARSATTPDQAYIVDDLTTIQAK